MVADGERIAETGTDVIQLFLVQGRAPEGALREGTAMRELRLKDVLFVALCGASVVVGLASCGKPAAAPGTAAQTAAREASAASPDAGRAGELRKVDLGGGEALELVYVPLGEFTMGSEGDSNATPDETPAHRVQISQGFWLGKYEVTQGQWQAVMGANPSYFPNDARQPVETVSWEDCQTFIRKLNEKGAGTFRLPTEAEWEYACRAGTNTRFFSGDSLTPNQANFHDETATQQIGSHSPVGQYPANTWGLHDMHGNVSEWCSDWYAEDYYAGSPAVDPPGPAAGEYRVLRGGSWHSNDNVWECRSANRNYQYPTDAGSGIGLRLACMP